MAIIKCPYCGKELDENRKFCPFCWQKLDTEIDEVVEIAECVEQDEERIEEKTSHSGALLLKDKLFNSVWNFIDINPYVIGMLFFFLLIIMFGIASQCSEKRGKSNWESGEVEESPAIDSVLVDDGDTIAILLKDEYHSKYIWTKKRFTEEDTVGLGRILAQLAPDVLITRYNLTTERNDYEYSYYGHTENGSFHRELTDEERFEIAYEECQRMARFNVTTEEDIETFLGYVSEMTSAYYTYKTMDKRGKLKALISNYFKKQFPRARKAFGDASRKRGWVDDIDIYQSGTTLSIYSYMYASNRSKQNAFEFIHDKMKRLRFKQVRIGLYKGGTDQLEFEYN